MTHEEKFDSMIDSAIHDRQALIQFLDGISDGQAEWHPPDGEWSIGEGVEHILLTDAWVRKTMEDQLREAKNSGKWDTAPKHPRKYSGAQLRRREQGRVEAPEHLIPQGKRPLSEMLLELMPSREKTVEMLKPFRAYDMERLVPPNSRYGDLNIYDRIEYMGIHDALHQEQMERVLKTPGYPTAG